MTYPDEFDRDPEAEEALRAWDRYEARERRAAMVDNIAVIVFAAAFVAFVLWLLVEDAKR